MVKLLRRVSDPCQGSLLTVTIHILEVFLKLGSVLHSFMVSMYLNLIYIIFVRYTKWCHESMSHILDTFVLNCQIQTDFLNDIIGFLNGFFEAGLFFIVVVKSLLIFIKCAFV